MTDDEKEAFKAEIAAEIGQQLDKSLQQVGELLVRKYAENHADTNCRLLDVETLLTMQELHRALDPTDSKWDLVATIRSAYAAKIRSRMAAWLKDMEQSLEANDGAVHVLRELFR